jgi:hypothetical protein
MRARSALNTRPAGVLLVGRGGRSRRMRNAGRRQAVATSGLRLSVYLLADCDGTSDTRVASGRPDPAAPGPRSTRYTNDKPRNSSGRAAVATAKSREPHPRVSPRAPTDSLFTPRAQRALRSVSTARRAKPASTTTQAARATAEKTVPSRLSGGSASACASVFVATAYIPSGKTKLQREAS